ncbi:MAG: protein tyrosine phosphatase, partial [Chthoniobacterales bacterium]
MADLQWAELILVMERRHAARIYAQFKDSGPLPPIKILDIPDDYEFMDSELIALLNASMESVL